MQEETFTLPVYYNNEYRDIPASLKLFGHTHKIAIRIGEHDVIFEPDEERNYRAIIQGGIGLPEKDVELLKAIAQALEAAFGS